MRLKIENERKKDIADYREGTCCICEVECNPRYRFYYWSDLEDTYGNPVIDGEIETCNKCYGKVKKAFK